MINRSPWTVVAVSVTTLALLTAACGGGTGSTTATDKPAYGSVPAAEADDLQAREQALQARERELAEREAEAGRAEAEPVIPTPAATPKTGMAHTTPKSTTKPSSAATSSAIPVSHSATPPRVSPPSRPVAQATKMVRVAVPTGTTIALEMIDTVSSDTSVVGDRFRARVLDDIVSDGWVAIPAGSTLEGGVTEVTGSDRIGGQAKLSVVFDRLELVGGGKMPINIGYVALGAKQAKKDAAAIGGGVAGGAVLGRILSKDKGKGTAVGAVVGGAIGTAIAAKAVGEPAVLASGTPANVTLSAPIEVELETAAPPSGS